jgi:hypothetical protein
MRKKNLLIATLLFLGSSISFIACNKENVSNPNNNNTAHLKGLFQNLKQTPQAFTIEAGTHQTITGAKGTLIQFNPNSFKDVNGNIISSGTLQVSLSEMYTPGDMIANRITTTTFNNRLLTSGGCINIKVTNASGQEVRAGSYTLGFKQPGFNDQNMALFYGEEIEDASGARVTWLDDATDTVERTIKLEQTNNNYYLFDSCTRFNWVNCDFFYTAPDPKTDIKVVMPSATYNYNSTQVYVVFPSINATSTLNTYDSITNTFSLGYSGYYLPVGTSIKIVVLSTLADGSYAMQVMDNITVTNNMTISSNPQSQSIAQIQAALQSL